MRRLNFLIGWHLISLAGAFLALTIISATPSRADNLNFSMRVPPLAESARSYAVTASPAGVFLGASTAKGLGCIPGAAPDPVRGLTVGCTYHDLQKFGSMGRQIASSPLDTLSIINFTWTNQDNISATGGRNVRYESYDPSPGQLLGDGTGGVDIGGDLIPPNRSGFTVLAAVSDGTVINAHDWDRFFGAPGSRFSAYVFQNQTPTLGDFVGGVVDSVLFGIPFCGFGGCPPPFNWPQISYTEPVSGPKVRHLVVSRDDPPPNHAVYARSVADSVWENTFTIEHLGYFRSPVIAASNQSRRVGIAFSAGRGDGTPLGGPINRINGELSGKNDNDIYIMNSEDAGATWTGPVNITLRDAPRAGDWAPHARVSALFDESDILHVVWQAVLWPGADSSFTTRSRMFHWDEASNTVRTAVDANWDPVFCDGGENTLNIDNPQLSTCDGKLYLTFTQYAPVPLGRGDDCAARAFSDDGNAAANGDIYLTVSDNGGFNWDAPRNVTNTYTPQCDTLPGSPLPDCDSDVWHSVIRYGIDITGQDFAGITDLTGNIDPAYTGAEFLFAQYINDSDPGAAIRGEGGWTNNMVKTVRFGCVDIVPVAALSSSLPAGRIVSDPASVLPAQDSTIPWRLENIGNVPLSYTVSIVNQAPLGNVTVTGGTGTIDNGAVNFEDMTLTLNALRTNTVQNASATVIIDGNFVSAPDTFRIDYCICDLQTLTFDSLDSALILGNNGNLGRRGNLGLGKLNLDFAGDPAECDTSALAYLFDGSPVVSYSGGVVTGMFSDNIADPRKFRPITEPVVDFDAPYEHASSGTFATQDSALGLTVDYWTPAGNLASAGTWKAAIGRVRYFNLTALPIDSVFCALALDWDVPSDSGKGNAWAIQSGALPTYIYQQGLEFGQDTGNAACRDNNTRYAATVYTLPSAVGVADYTNGGSGLMGVGFQSLCARLNSDFMDDDWNHPALDSILRTNFGIGCIPFGMPPPDFQDRFTLFNGGAYRIDPDDTLELWFRMLTGFGTQTEFEQAAQATIELRHPGSCCKLAGDANDDGRVNVADITFVIARIFAGGPAPDCCEEGDANGDGSVNVADITYEIARIFAGGPPPVCGPSGMGC